MTLNNFLEAVAEKLVGLWPDRHVFVNEIPKDSDGNFFVGIIEATQEKKLDRAAGVMSRLKFFISWRRRITLTSTNGLKKCWTNSNP